MKPIVKTILRAMRRNLIQVSHWLDGYEPVGAGTVPKSLKICTDDYCRVCRKMTETNSRFRMIYLLPSNNSPCGGNKVTYREIEIISGQGVQCVAFHAEKPGASYGWFSHNVKSLSVGHFNPHRDFLVFSEMWAAVAARFCIPAGLRYAIYVQNGYLAHNSAGFQSDVVRQAYRHADLVLSISSDTTEIISLLYPFVPKERILRIVPSVPPLFSPGEKERLITYMPRRLREHSDRLCLYLRNALPDGWQLRAIENLDERGVAAIMSRSSVFLSFSDLEGYGLPPIEAALSGNVVVGYTGQGAKEYFRRPIFREVQNGDLRYYVTQVCSAIGDAERGVSHTKEFLEQATQLAEVHSAANETTCVMNFVKRARELMGTELVQKP